MNKIIESLDYYNLTDKDGWKVSYINTDMQDGVIKEFINKENKWFNYIKGTDINVNERGKITSVLDSSEFSFQGLGYSDGVNFTVVIEGCMDDQYIEYNPNANVDDGSCSTLIISGCMNPSAFCKSLS